MHAICILSWVREWTAKRCGSGSLWMAKHLARIMESTLMQAARASLASVDSTSCYVNRGMFVTERLSSNFSIQVCRCIHSRSVKWELILWKDESNLRGKSRLIPFHD